MVITIVRLVLMTREQWLIPFQSSCESYSTLHADQGWQLNSTTSTNDKGIMVNSIVQGASPNRPVQAYMEKGTSLGPRALNI